MTMDCDHHQRLLIDVACGDTHVPGAVDARAHAIQCPTCGPALQTLEQSAALALQLPVMEPSARSIDQIMQAARNHSLAARTLARSPARTQGDFAASLSDRVRTFLSQFAMGRQVAMATMMVLVIAVGAWFVPRARHHELAGGNVVNPDTDGEAGPSDGIVPAAPLDLDLRQGRIRARGDEASRKRTRDMPVAVAPSPSESQTTSETAAERAEDESSTVGVAGAQEAEGDFARAVPAAAQALPLADDFDNAADGELSGPPTQALASADPPGARRLPTTRATSPKAMGEASAPFAAAPAAGRASTGSDDALGHGYAPPPAPAQRPQPSPMTTAGGQAPAAESSARAERATAAPSELDALAVGAEQFRVGNYQAAAATFESELRRTAGQLPGSARLSLARSYQRTGRCDSAVAHYEMFLRSAARASDAMLELAACYRQLGQTAQAEQWTNRAAGVASTDANKKSVPAKPTSAAPAH